MSGGAGSAGFLTADRDLLERRLPGLDAQLASVGLDKLERPGSPAVDWFRRCGAGALFVPAEHQGLGAGLREGVRLQRAIASRAPSLAVATTMHHFSVASLIGWEHLGAGLEWLLAEAIAGNSMLVASGAAEGRPGAGILTPVMTARPTDGGVLVSGTKKPCSLSHSMDLLFATVRVQGPGGERCAVAVVTAGSEGLSSRPFWKSEILAGAESDELVLHDVFVPERLVTDLGPVGTTSAPLRRSLVWFEVLIAASYLGMAAALVERAAAAPRVGAADLARMAVLLEAATYALEGVAARSETEPDPAALLGPSLAARFAAQDAAVTVAALAAEALGGGAYLNDPEVAYLCAATRCLAFHPPSRAAGTAALVQYLRGEAVDVP
ncbi:Acyl-CoA dehydrogenase [Streptomyces sp. yr375]|uniref:acyl-CoA dehydrogenase family protein n=1 Tax=Streptomyces sp. yr375 TaxID=1761906 RepID=UPI0008B0F263|nr:acyl-CoA dehydrogenase family protein [Streptomyces sp. yr375]SER48109.1 Acyl-CoA dehydrogenase [Streptomyces sp. yr375]